MKMEKRQKFSIRKFSIGVASVIVGQFYLGVMATAPKVKADERLTTEVSVLATSEERHLSNVALPSEAEEKHKDSIQEPTESAEEKHKDAIQEPTESKVISEVESNSASPVVEEAEKPEASISDEKIKENPSSVVPSKSDEQKESSATATKDVEEVTLPRIRKARSVTSENRQDRQVYDYANPEFSRQMMLLGQVGTYQDPEHGSRNHNNEVYKYGFFPVGEAFKGENLNRKRPILDDDFGGARSAEYDSLTSKDPIDFSKDFTVRYRGTVMPGEGRDSVDEAENQVNGFGISFLPLDLDQLAADFNSKYKVPKFSEKDFIPNDHMWSRRLPGLSLNKDSIGLRIDLSRTNGYINGEPNERQYQVDPPKVKAQSPNPLAPFASFFKTTVIDFRGQKRSLFSLGSVSPLVNRDGLENRDVLENPDVYFFKRIDPEHTGEGKLQTFITTLEYKAATKQLTATVRSYAVVNEDYEGYRGKLLPNPEVRTFSMDISDFVEKHKNEKVHMVLSSTGGLRYRDYGRYGGFHITNFRQVRQHTSEGNPASTYNPTGTDLTTKWGVMPDSASAITNKDELPIDTSYSWQTPPNVQVSGQQDAVIRVTYPNNETEDVNIKVTVTAPDKDKYQPTTQTQTVNLNAQPNPADAVTNKGSLPPGTTYDWKAPVPTNTVGDKPATVVVTYPDKTVDEVPATVKVVDNRPDKDKYQPTTAPVTTNINTQPNPADAVTNKGSLPPGTTYGWKTPVPTDTAGDKPATVVVTYPDKTVDEVPATVKVVDNRPDKDKYQPTTQTQTVNLNAQPNPADAVTNKGSLPPGTTYGWKTPVPTNTVGDKQGTVVVTYPDKTVDEVPATVKVVDNRPDKDKYQPTTQTQTVNLNAQPNPADAVTNKGSLPNGTTYGWKTPVPTNTVGDKQGTVVVTYPDKTVDEVPATVKVVDNRPDKDKYQPTTQTQTVNLNAQPNPADAVTNKGSLPNGTTYGWKTPVPTNTVGDKQGTVVVTYPDKTVDEVPATVKVVDNRPDKDKYQPTTQTQTVNLNAQPNPADAVTNKGSLPPGTTYGWKAPVPTNTVGDKQGTVVVTYPDKTVDEVPATVKVVDNRPDKDKYQPTTAPVTTNINTQPNPADAVTNKGSLPPGTTYGWKTPVPTDTAGDKPATVVVTYPDKTVDEVPATVKVVDNRPDKDKYQPTTQTQTVNLNAQPNPADAVTNKGSLPNGTTYGWKTPVPTNTVGDKQGTVVVTYPDKTVDEVPATVKVVDNRPDKDKYQPTTAPVTTNINTQPNPADAVTNKGSLPNGTTYGWKAPVPTDTAGDKPATVVVTYPDKTVDEVPATVKVVDNRPDKDKYQPTTAPVTTNINTQPNPADAVTNKGSLPPGTTYGWKTPVPTDTAGDKPATVVVTYPDKTVDEVPATVKVVDNRPDKDKYQPTTQTQTVNLNAQPNPADAVTNKGSLPPGTTYGWKTPVPTNTVGDKQGTVVVTYPDKTVDEVPATVKVVDNRPDKDKYQPTTQTQTVNLNAQPNPADAVTNKGSLPNGTTYGWKTPVPTNTVGDKQGTVVVTYPDKTVDEVPATVKVVDNRPDKDKYQPTTQTQTVNLNAQPNPADAVTNKGSLPPGTTYGWKAPVPTNTVGDKQGTVVVTYPDKTVDEVPATVKVVDNRPDKDKYQPTTAPVTTNINTQPNPADAVTNKGSLPPGTTYGWKTPVPTDTAGDKPATVVVTYPDKTVDEVPATVKVVDNRPDKDKYQPTTQTQTVNLNAQPNPADAVTNKGSLPNGTTYGWKTPVPTNTVGDKQGTVVVTYPDKTVDEVPATVKVVDNRPDKDKYQPTTAPVTTNINTQPNPADAVTNKGSLPNGTTYGWKAPVPTDTAGDKPATVVVTYPDKTVDEVPATVKVVDNRPDKDKYQPTTAPVTTNINTQPNPADAVTNKGSLPPGTTYGWKTPVPTDTAGDKPATVVVTYPDKTVDEVPATVKVVDNRPDKDKYQPTTQTQTVNLNAQPNPADAVTNKGSLPPGTTYGWKTPVPTNTVGDKQGTVVVTYPDKTVDEVPATVKVVDNRPDKDKYQPTTQTQTVNLNAQPNPADAVTNKGSLPNGTTYGWKTPVPTNTVGDKQGTVVVTYPDKTVDEVPATVKVVDNRPDKDKYQPTTQTQTVNLNAQPNPADAVTNKGSLPNGTTYGWKTPVPTNTVGDKQGTVVVTYPDKTVDEVPATVKVVDNRPDKDKYQPTTQTQTVNLNAQPNPADAVTNKGSLPNGTTYGWKTPVPTDTAGDKPATVVVTYPDKTVDEVPATVKVVDNRPDKDKYQPTTQTQTVNLNAQPNPADAVTNKGSLPNGTTYGWKTPVPTNTVGDKQGTVVVTYPDKTVDEVPATVKVVDNRPDKDKYQPTTAPVSTGLNGQPNPADAVTNKGSLPPGTTYEWKTPVPTDTVGDKPATVVVTYPDKTVDEVPATVKVVDNRPDKDKYQPTTAPVTTDINIQPNPADAVTNKDSLPPGTTYDWKTPVPTDTAGDKPATVVVTYPDKTVDEVPATVKVVDNRGDKGDTGTNGNQTGDTNGNQTGDTNGNQTGDTNGNQTGGTNGNQTGGTNGNQTGGTNGNQTGGTNGNQTGGTNGNQTGDTNGNQTGDTNGNQTGGTNGNQTGGTNGNQTGGTNGNQTGGTNGNQTGGTNGNQTGGTNGNQTGGTNGNQTGGTNGNQTGGTNGNQTGGTNGNQTGGTNGNQTGDTNGNQTGDTNGNQTGDTNGNQTGGTNGNQTGGTNGNQTGGTNGNQTGGTNGNQTGGTNGNQTGGTNGNQTGGTNGNQTGGTNGNQTGGTNGNQTGGTNGNQTGGTAPIQPVPVLTAVNSGELPLNKGNAFDKKATLPNTGSKPTSHLPAAIWTILGTAGLLYAAKQRKDEKDFEAEIMNLK